MMLPAFLLLATLSYAEATFVCYLDPDVCDKGRYVGCAHRQKENIHVPHDIHPKFLTSKERKEMFKCPSQNAQPANAHAGTMACYRVCNADQQRVGCVLVGEGENAMWHPVRRTIAPGDGNSVDKLKAKLATVSECPK